MNVIKEWAERIKNENLSAHDFEKIVEEFASDKLINSGTFKEAFKLSSAEMNELYRKAYEHYMADKYEESRELFRLLLLFDPLIEKYWMGFAASHMLNADYRKALSAYAMVALLNPKDPFCHFHAYECFTALNEEGEAFIALELASEKAIGPSFAPLRQKIDEIGRKKCARSA